MFHSESAETGSSAARAIELAMMTSMMKTSKSGKVTTAWMAHRKPFVELKMNMDE